MSEDFVTEQETSAPVVEDVETVTPDFDDMSDDEFEKEFDGIGSEEPVEGDPKEPKEPTDDDLYSKQISDPDATLEKAVVLKHDGQVYKIDKINELRDLAEKGFNATKKFQKLAADRKALEQQLQDLGQVPDVEPAENEDVTAVNDVAQRILDADYATTFQSDVSKLPQSVRTELGSNAELLRGLSVDYESGIAQKIMPHVSKLMNVNGMDFVDAYMKAGNEIMATQQQTDDKRKTLTSQPKASMAPEAVADIDNMDDAAFERYFSSL